MNTKYLIYMNINIKMLIIELDNEFKMFRAQ